MPVDERGPRQDLDSRDPVERPDVVVVRDERVRPGGQLTLEEGVVVFIVGHRVHRKRGFDHAGEVGHAFDRTPASPRRKRQVVVIEHGSGLSEERE